jgi:hypothetical protein
LESYYHYPNTNNKFYQFIIIIKLKITQSFNSFLLSTEIIYNLLGNILNTMFITSNNVGYCLNVFINKRLRKNISGLLSMTGSISTLRNKSVKKIYNSFLLSIKSLFKKLLMMMESSDLDLFYNSWPK